MKHSEILLESLWYLRVPGKRKSPFSSTYICFALERFGRHYPNSDYTLWCKIKQIQQLISVRLRNQGTVDRWLFKEGYISVGDPGNELAVQLYRERWMRHLAAEYAAKGM